MSFCQQCGYQIGNSGVCERCYQAAPQQPFVQQPIQQVYAPVPQQAPYAYHQQYGQQPVQGQAIQSVVYLPAVNQSNGVGTAGFVLALLGLIFCWVPIVGWILCALGLILSFAGLFKSPRGLAIAGFILSTISVILFLALISALTSFSFMR